MMLQRTVAAASAASRANVCEELSVGGGKAVVTSNGGGGRIDYQAYARQKRHYASSNRWQKQQMLVRQQTRVSIKSPARGMKGMFC